MNSIMLDCETLSTSPDAVILSIAAVEFNPFEITTDFSKNKTLDILINIDEQVQLGRVIDDSTVTWWGQQPQDVQNKLFAEEGRLSVISALTELRKFCWNKDRIWCQGTDFDISLLNNAYTQTKQPKPWKYWQVRDSRTLLDLIDVSQPTVTHDSIEDCKRQVMGVQQVLDKLNVKRFIR